MAARFYYTRVWELVRHIIWGDDHPLGRIVDVWLRVEFQDRGSLHIHALFWALLHHSVEPVYDEVSGEYLNIDDPQLYDGNDICAQMTGIN
jgi:hypothetical protein